VGNTTKPEFVYDAVNEILVIQAVKKDSSLLKTLVHHISPDEFLVPSHVVIWKALRSISNKSLELTSDVVQQFILIEGGDSKLVEYYNALGADEVRNLEYHVDTLKWDSTRARILKLAIPKLIKVLGDSKASQHDVLGIARSLVKSFDGASRKYIHRPSELYRSYKADVTARCVNKKVYNLGHSCVDDNLSEGFMPGRTTVTAGLSGSGKSTVWMAFVISLAKLNRKILWVCLEMDANSMLDLAVSHLTGINLRDIIRGNLSVDDIDRIDTASKWILSKIIFMGNPFYKFTGKQSNGRNLDALEGYITESGCDIAVYDIWERILVYTKPDDVTKALYRMQAIHQEYAVHGVIVQQLRLKDLENRVDKRPTRASIKGVGSYVEVADLIIGIHRDGQFKNVEDNSVETICLKQRKGIANWSVRWDWDGSRCYIGNPRSVPYDPGLENSFDVGDISGIKSRVSRGYQKIGARK
jgi:replicative DNA helicase